MIDQDIKGDSYVIAHDLRHPIIEKIQCYIFIIQINFIFF